MPLMFHITAPVNNPGDDRGLNGAMQAWSCYCSPFYQLTANYISSLTFSNWLFHVAYEGKGKKRRGVGEVEAGGLTIKHHQERRRSIHDIRLNEYMNSNETRLSLFWQMGPGDSALAGLGKAQAQRDGVMALAWWRPCGGSDPPRTPEPWVFIFWSDPPIHVHLLSGFPTFIFMLLSVDIRGESTT